MAKATSEVFYLASYNGDLGRGWCDIVAGGVGHGCEVTTEDFVKGVLQYFDNLDAHCESEIQLLIDNYDLDSDDLAEKIREIRAFQSRAKTCDRDHLKVLAEQDWNNSLEFRP